MKKAHVHALWIYGVIVGLAIRESLAQTLAHMFPQNHPAQPPHVGDQQLILESLRVVTFLITVIRFYFGAALYFDEMYGDDAGNGHRSFGFDFLTGMAHFLVFFAWSYSITFHTRFSHGLSGFLTLLFVVLLYDVFWYLASLRYDTAQFIGLWTLLNLLTFLISFSLFIVATWFTSQEIAESICLIPVILVAIVDLGDMASGKNLVIEWLGALIKRRQL